MALKIFDQEIVNQHRRRFATYAQDHDFLLKHAAEDIVDRLTVISRDFSVALDLGAHHGILGRRLTSLDKINTMISLENCMPLLEQCNGIKIFSDPEYLPFSPASLNLVVSAFGLQFVNDLPGTLLQIRKSLKPDGLFIGVVAGGRTLHELREAFAVAEEELEGGVSPRVAPFLDVRDAGSLLQRAGFNLPVADIDNVTVSYETPFHLMNELQRMGAANALHARQRKPLRRQTLMRMAEIYQSRFSDEQGRVTATFELVTLTGWSPHESQQKPLKPGSAQISLADILGSEQS